ncbi:MAG: polysaccharide biosynthesis tyrosine autokinase [Lachnospiraceae bacterium]
MVTVELKGHTSLDFKSDEAYKTVRTNISFCGKDVKVIGLTSCQPGEGKSGVCVNLAMSMAESGKRVLILDGDLRKSVLAGKYSVNGSIKGFSHFLSGQATMQDVLCATDVKNLHIIFAGKVPPNPAELLGKRTFSETLRVLRGLYDYIIVDTPPLGSVIDSAIIAQECDGMVLVIAQNATSHKFAQRVMEQLEKTECPILGAILNKVDNSNRYYGGYGRYGGYGKYGKYGEY